MSRSLTIIAVLCSAASLPHVGCQRTPYQLAPVRGSVTLDGEPLARGVVNFQPIAMGRSDVGPGSTGRCDLDGHFQLTTIHQESGAVVGDHRVRIYSYSPETPSNVDTDASPHQERVPEKFNYRTTLTFTVPADGTETARFELQTTQDAVE